jgi:hypothetical protein
MAKVPFVQILDYQEAFHDSILKRQFELTNSTKLNLLSYFSTLPSGDIVSDADFDLYLSDQMFEEEFEFTVADDTSVAMTNLKNSLTKMEAQGFLNFSKQSRKKVGGLTNSKLVKQNTCNIGDRQSTPLIPPRKKTEVLAFHDEVDWQGESHTSSRLSIPQASHDGIVHRSLRDISDNLDLFKNETENPLSSPTHTLHKFQRFSKMDSRCLDDIASPSRFSPKSPQKSPLLQPQPQNQEWISEESDREDSKGKKSLESPALKSQSRSSCWVEGGDKKSKDVSKSKRSGRAIERIRLGSKNQDELGEKDSESMVFGDDSKSTVKHRERKFTLDDELEATIGKGDLDDQIRQDNAYDSAIPIPVNVGRSEDGASNRSPLKSMASSVAKKETKFSFIETNLGRKRSKELSESSHV